MEAQKQPHHAEPLMFAQFSYRWTLHALLDSIPQTRAAVGNDRRLQAQRKRLLVSVQLKFLDVHQLTSTTSEAKTDTTRDADEVPKSEALSTPI